MIEIELMAEIALLAASTLHAIVLQKSSLLHSLDVRHYKHNRLRCRL